MYSRTPAPKVRHVAAAVAAGHRDTVASHLAWVGDRDRERYALSGNSKLPREVDHELQMWGCVACNFCVTVCPNDAFFKVPSGDLADVDGRQQYFLLAELCNECGNCMTFCPETGDPALVKPRLFLTEERFRACDGQAFLLGSGTDLTVTADPTVEAEVPRLLQLLTSDEGLPL